MNRKSLLGILTLLLFLMGIISTLGIERAHALPMSEADARIDWDTFSVNRNGTPEVSVEYCLLQNLNTDVSTAQASSETWLWLAETDMDVIYSENLFALSNDITEDYSESGILPELATIIFLGCGLMGIAGLGKRRL